MPTFREVAEGIGIFIDGVGIAVIVVGLTVASFHYLSYRAKVDDGYKRYRRDLGRAILLGLEFLVAADIIRTVAVAPTLEQVFLLGIIVLIRTLLSMALEVELEGRWPWQSKP